MRRSYATQNLLRLTRATSCIQCRDNLVNSYSPWLFSQVATMQRLRENYDRLYASDTTSKANTYLAAQVKQAEEDLAHLQEFMATDLHNRSLEKRANTRRMPTGLPYALGRESANTPRNVTYTL